MGECKKRPTQQQLSWLHLRAAALLILFVLGITATTKTYCQTTGLPSNNTSTANGESQKQEAINITTTTPGTNTSEISILSWTPSEQEIEQAKKLIQETATTMKDNPHRLALNKPISPSSSLCPQHTPLEDLAPKSIELLASDATTQFGLNFMRNSGVNNSAQNVLISPLSLQNLLSMLLLGSEGESELELAQVLGYEASGLLHKRDKNETTATACCVEQSERMRPHQALHNVFEMISKATRCSPAEAKQPDDDSHAANLLNTNLQDLQQGKPKTQTDAGPLVRAHLQTNEQNNTQPLDAQLNFTLANLMLTNRDTVQLDANYELDLKHFYKVQMEQFSRSKSPNASLASDEKGEKKLHERVNDWVKQMTQNQIEQLVSEGDLNEDDESQQLAMVLLNAAHFKGRWLHTFAQKATQMQTFYGARQQQEAPFMRQKGEFGFAEFGLQPPGGANVAGSSSKVYSAEDAETLLTEDNVGEQAAGKTSSSTASSGMDAKRQLAHRLNCSALAMPFSLNDGKELSMVFLLPNKRDGLEELMASLDFGTLNEVYKTLREQQQQVQVELPKFAFESTHDARATLERMGLKRVFKHGQAQLARMLNHESAAVANALKVDKVMHKAKIQVDESGAEAAAASLVSIVSRNFVRPAPVFLVNRPFLFVIRHTRSNMPLFMGQVNSLP